MNPKIYEYAVLYHPKSSKKNGEEETKPSQLIVDVRRVVAKDEKSVAMMAAREIPKEYDDKLDLVEIAIRPF